MADEPGVSLYHRIVGSHAPALRRLMVAAAVGVSTLAVTLWVFPWQLTGLVAWDVTAAVLLLTIWTHIAGADPERTALLATRQDETRATAGLLLVVASVASLVGVAAGLLATRDSGTKDTVLLIGASLLTVVLSWALVNTVFTLRYAHLYYVGQHGGISFGDEGPPDYRDFAYVAFTVGMTYQVADTDLETRVIRRTVLRHALLSYLFGVVIVATTINVVAGLF